VKNFILIIPLSLIFLNNSFSQFKYVDEFPVNFDINNVQLGTDENIVNVSGVSADGKWNVKMTWKFTNLLDTKDSGEYTALAWAQDGENFLQTTVRGVWKRNGQVFDVKHFENGTDGNQLLTTGTFDFVNNTYKCLVRVLE
jgi:hypothetical protein